MKKRWIRGGVGKLLWGVGLLVALVILVWVVLSIASGVKLRRAIAAWQEEGLSVDIGDLETLLPEPAPSEENAAVILQQVVPMREVQDPGHWRLRQQTDLKTAKDIPVALAEELLPRIGSPEVSKELLSQLEAALEDHNIAYALRVAREAVSHERFDAYLPYDLGMELSMPYLGELRALSEIIQAEAILRAAQGRWPDAYETLIVSLELGALVGQEPLVGSRMIRGLIERETLKLLETFCRLSPPGPDFWKRFQKILPEAHEPDLLGMTMMADLIVAADYFYGQAQADPALDDVVMRVDFFPRPNRMLFRPLHKADLATWMDATRRMIVLLREGSSSFDYYKIVKKWQDEYASALPWYAFLTKDLLSAMLFPEILLNDVQTEARIALARVALSAHAYRNEYDEWPESLDDLVPAFLTEIPRDPFGDAAPIYVMDEDRVVIYSVGPNEEDDGGNSGNGLPADEPSDIVWVLEEAGSESAFIP